MIHRDGFNTVFPLEHLKCLYEDEIETMLCGTREHWTVDMLADTIKFDHGYALQLYASQGVQLHVMPYQLRAFEDEALSDPCTAHPDSLQHTTCILLQNRSTGLRQPVVKLAATSPCYICPALDTRRNRQEARPPQSLLLCLSSVMDIITEGGCRLHQSGSEHIVLWFLVA